QGQTGLVHPAEPWSQIFPGLCLHGAILLGKNAKCEGSLRCAPARRRLLRPADIAVYRCASGVGSPLGGAGARAAIGSSGIISVASSASTTMTALSCTTWVTEPTMMSR